jgi:hypothetical protein
MNKSQRKQLYSKKDHQRISCATTPLRMAWCQNIKLKRVQHIDKSPLLELTPITWQVLVVKERSRGWNLGCSKLCKHSLFGACELCSLLSPQAFQKFRCAFRGSKMTWETCALHRFIRFTYFLSAGQQWSTLRSVASCCSWTWMIRDCFSTSFSSFCTYWSKHNTHLFFIKEIGWTLQSNFIQLNLQRMINTFSVTLRICNKLYTFGAKTWGKGMIER